MDTIANLLIAVVATGGLFGLGAVLHAIRHPKA
jgi:hypothetical protein